MRPSPSRNKTQGFTIVELIIVVSVIAILASIVAVSYNGAARRTVEASMRSDLLSAASTLEAARQTKNKYPEDANSISTTGDNTLVYDVRPYGFCISATSSKTSATYVVRSLDKTKVEDGVCSHAMSTMTGSATQGYQDGTSTNALFNMPYTSGILLGPDGSFYVGDTANNRIRLVAPDGSVQTFAGSGGAGATDGPKLNAEIRSPGKMARAADGTIYVKEYWQIRAISPSGVVTSLPVPWAVLSSVDGIAIDSAGVIYAAGNHSILKVTPTGVITTLAGSGTAGFADGTGAAAQFNTPGGIALDKSGNLYVADTHNHRIRKVSPSGVVTTLAGSGAYGTTAGGGPNGAVDGTGVAATFTLPRGIAIDRNNYLYVVQDNLGHIRRVSPEGTVTTLSGPTDGGAPSQFTTGETSAIAVDNSNGNIYVASWSRVWKIEQ